MRQSRASLPASPVVMTPASFRSSYIEHLLGYIDAATLKPLKIVVNAGNGAAGPLLDELERHLPLRLIKIHHEPDGRFPNGIPNPLLPSMRVSTSMAVQEHRADFGVAWDGDFDRCFLFDEQGRFIEGYYIVGLLAQALLQQKGPSRIVHDPRLTWNTIDIVRENGGTPVLSKTGHAFIKERMRLEDAAYGGEMSAHHYFRDFGYCDNGMIPWLLVASLVGASGQPLSQLVRERIARFPSSGELNFSVDDVAAALQRIHDHYAADAVAIDWTDGLSIESAETRFNVRASNTEPLLRLNVESRGDEDLMRAVTAALSTLIRSSQTAPVRTMSVL